MKSFGSTTLILTYGTVYGTGYGGAIQYGIGDPDPVGSGPFCRIRTFLSHPDPEILSGSGSDPLKVLITNQKRLFFHINIFSTGTCTSAFQQTLKKNLRTFGQNYQYLKQRQFELFTKSGEFYSLGRIRSTDPPTLAPSVLDYGTKS
jgi:hypothetical protein